MMTKHLLLLPAFLLPLSATKAQVATAFPQPGKGQPIVLSTGHGFVPSSDGGGERSTTCTDKVTFVDRHPGSSFTQLGGPASGGWDALLQSYPGLNAQITKVDFNAATFSGGSKTVEVDIYNPSFTILATTTATVTGTSSANFTATFSTPANITGDYYIGIWPPAGDSIKLYVNGSGDANGYAYGQSGSTLYNWYSDFGYDYDLLLRPTIKFTSVNPSFTATPSTVCPSTSVSFDVSPASTTPGHYNTSVYNPNGIETDFAFGDGGTANPSGLYASAPHSYSTSGTKNATAKYVYHGWSSDCPSDVMTQTVTVNPPTVANFAWSATGLAVTFTNMSSGATSYSWAFGEGGTATAPNPVHNYAASGTYTVELTATGPCGTDHAYANITITDSTNGGNVGMQELENGMALQLYPNPAHQSLTVDLSLQANENVTLQVFGAMGQLVYSRTLGQVRKTLQTIDVSGYEPGIYFIRVSHNQTVSTRKFLRD